MDDVDGVHHRNSPLPGKVSAKFQKEFGGAVPGRREVAGARCPPGQDVAALSMKLTKLHASAVVKFAKGKLVPDDYLSGLFEVVAAYISAALESIPIQLVAFASPRLMLMLQVLVVLDLDDVDKQEVCRSLLCFLLVLRFERFEV